MNEPLAIKLRPTKLSEIIGQENLIGKEKILTNLVKNKHLYSMILYGHPGTGKTSIANAIVNELGMTHRFLNAVINNKKDFDIVVEEAKMYNGLILVMDEIHRLNKDKQDLLLPQIESGLIILIGLTTSNPYHSINPAIRSRCHLFELQELTEDDIKKGLNKAIKSEFLSGIDISSKEIDYIVKLAAFDLRYAYNLLDMCYYASNDKKITLELIKSINNKPVSYHDKNDDGYYDVLSAFQKSIRGSDVDASLHYLARLLDGADIDAICRRLAVIVYEDIGLANSSMGPKVMSAITAVERLGLPEGRIVLSAIVIEMAMSPKSNSAELAIDKALNDINIGNSGSVPKHINNSAFDYKYPHLYKNNYVDQQYLPDKLKGVKYYNPGKNKNERLFSEFNENIKRD